VGVKLGVVCAVVGVVLALPGVARADGWLPHPTDASWTYEWRDSVYAPTPTKEKVTVKEVKGSSFTLAWTTEGLENAPEAVASAGTVSFQETNAGLVNTDWTSNPPPASFPVLCGQAAGCPNALSSVYYNVIWGSRAPVLAGPLVKGLAWSSSGGAQGDVSSSAEYVGTERITVPAFPQPVTAAKVETQVTQAGAIGDPYGSGVRTVWWVFGVGPVKIEFQHAGGSGAPVTTAALLSTNQVPAPTPTDADYFPLVKGATTTYRWTNKKHLPKPQVERVTVDAVANSSARLLVKHVSGPIRVEGSYGFSRRLDGLTNLWGTVRAATQVKFPALGPSSVAASKRRHFFTPFDLMNFGFNPILTAYPAAGQTWSATKPSRDFTAYGVTGTTKVLGVRGVKVPAGTFQALVVQSTLNQPGFPFGSGLRTAWFAPGKGLVKLVFAHRDRSTSVVELLK
jgi:hypothetical protein